MMVEKMEKIMMDLPLDKLFELIEKTLIFLEEIYNVLQTNPDDILKILNENLEELELEDNYQERDDYKKTKEIIEEIEQFKEQSQEDEMEM